MTQKTTHYRLCLSTNVTATGPGRPDDEVYARLREAFTEDEGRRYSLHAEAIAYHLRELIGWALWQGKRKTKPQVGIDASEDKRTADKGMEERRVISVDCFLKSGEVPTKQTKP